MILFQSEDGVLPKIINDSLKSWIDHVIKNEDYKLGDIVYFFCSDTYILNINKSYLNHDYFTDIITFDYTSNKVISGDLVISLDTVSSNSKQFQTTFENELYRVIIHGILHLLGYKDKSDLEAQLMRQKEDEALSILPTFL